MNFNDILEMAPFSNSEVGSDFFMEVVPNEKGEGLEPMLSDEREAQQHMYNSLYYSQHPYYFQYPSHMASNTNGPIADLCTFSLYDNSSAMEVPWLQSAVNTSTNNGNQLISMTERVASSNAVTKPEQKRKRRNSTELKDSKVKQCYNCKTTSTPQWRKGPNKISLCNRCGLYFIRHLCLNPSAGGDANNTGKTDTATAVSSVPTTQLSETPNQHYASITVEYCDQNGDKVLGCLKEKDVVDFVVSYLDTTKKNANKL